MQSDGKVLVTGFAVPTAAPGTEFFLLRTLRDGGLDASFAPAARSYTGFNNGAASDEAQAVAVQADGKILVAGASDQGATGYDFALARYNADGSLDASFGTGGRRHRLRAAVRQGLCGARAARTARSSSAASVQATTGGDFALARYNADGSLDASFGQGGKVLTPIGEFGAREAIYGLALQTVGGSIAHRGRGRRGRLPRGALHGHRPARRQLRHRRRGQDGVWRRDRRRAQRRHHDRQQDRHRRPRRPRHGRRACCPMARWTRALA